MDIAAFARAVFSDGATNFVLLLLVILPFVQWVTGILRAIAGNIFSWDYVDVFIRTDLAGRVLPLTILLLLGRIVETAAPAELNVPGLDIGLLTGAGMVAAVPYLIAVVTRIIANVNPAVPDTLPAPE